MASYLQRYEYAYFILHKNIVDSEVPQQDYTRTDRIYLNFHKNIKKNFTFILFFRLFGLRFTKSRATSKLKLIFRKFELYTQQNVMIACLKRVPSNKQERTRTNGARDL